MDWIETNLKDLVDIKTGKKDANEGDENGEFRFYTCARDYSYIKDYAFDEEAILISGNGAYVGYVHYYKGKFDAYQRTYILSNFKIDVFFLLHYLGENLRFRIHREKQDGATPYIKKGTLSKFKIKYPENSSEQTAIATILSKVDETIEATHKSIKAAEKLKKALMQNLLTGKLNPDGTWRTDDEFYEDEKFGKVPVGWEVARVKDYGFVQTGKTPPTAEPKVFSETENEKRFPFITPGDLGDSKYVSISERYVTEKGIGFSYKLPPNSICVVCIGSTIGKIGIISKESCTNQQINALIANDNNSSEFFYYMMEYRKPHFKEIAGINATPQINKSGFNKYKLLRPKSKEEQEAIANKLKSVDADLLSKRSKIKTLQRLKKSLMQNLLTGKVRLPEEFIKQFEVEENNKEIIAE